MTSQAEIINPNLSVILYFPLITLTQFILKPLVSIKYSGLITMKTICKGFIFSGCEVIAWAREVKHWTSTEEKCNIQVRISTLQHTALKFGIWVKHVMRVYKILKLIATGSSL